MGRSVGSALGDGDLVLANLLVVAQVMYFPVNACKETENVIPFLDVPSHGSILPPNDRT